MLSLRNSRVGMAIFYDFVVDFVDNYADKNTENYFHNSFELFPSFYGKHIMSGVFFTRILHLFQREFKVHTTSFFDCRQ